MTYSDTRLADLGPNIPLKVQKKLRKTNKHPNGNQAAPDQYSGRPVMRRRFAELTVDCGYPDLPVRPERS